MPESVELENEIKQLIIESLGLEDLSVADIDSDAPLFGEGLGLDSIDALELALALEERFGVHVEDDAEANRQIFACVKSLTVFVLGKRSGNGSGPA